MEENGMEIVKRQYQAPVLVFQGGVVEKTMGGVGGSIWDGSPHIDQDTRKVELDDTTLQ
jgi:hypothetical protein